MLFFFFFFSSRRRHTRWPRDWSSDVCSSDLGGLLYWGQGRGTKAERLPLLLLIAGGVPLIAYFIETLRAGALAYGGWVFTAGYVLALGGGGQGRRAAPGVAPGAGATRVLPEG